MAGPGDHGRNLSTSSGGGAGVTRWAAAAASIWIECCAGASYSFSIYSHALKSHFSLTQQQLGLLSVFKDAGECVGLTSGILHDAFSASHVIVVGIAHNIAGYVLMWLFLTGHVPPPPLWGLCLTLFVAVNSQTYYNTACIVTCVANFPAHRGLVLGLLKGCLALSSTILTVIWKLLPAPAKESGTSFLLVAAFVPSAVAAGILPAIRRSADVVSAAGEKRRLGRLSAPVVALALFLMAVSGSGEGEDKSSFLNTVELAVVVTLLLLPCILARWFKPSPELQFECDCACLLLPPALPGMAEKPLKAVFRDTDFVLLVFASAVTLGSGLAAVNNLSQVAASLGYSSSGVGVAVSVVSTWQFVGRFGVGVASDYALKQWGVGRPLLTCMAAFILAAAYAVIADGRGSLYLACAAIGLSTGASWSLYPTTVSELFGLQHFGTLYNVVVTANPLASYVLSVWVVGYLYDDQAAMQRTSLCMGRGCFSRSFFLLAGVAFVAAKASFLLFCRTRLFYCRLQRTLVEPTPENVGRAVSDTFSNTYAASNYQVETLDLTSFIL